MWQKHGNQGEEWQKVQLHVTLQHVHQVILEATVGGEVGDIAIDDISFSSGACPVTGTEKLSTQHLALMVLGPVIVTFPLNL